MLNTEEIMEVSLRLTGFESVPEDSAIYVEGTSIKKVLFAIDVGASELFIAKKYGYDCVIAHHPMGGSAVTNFHKVFGRHVKQMIDAGITKHVAETAVCKKKSSLDVQKHTESYKQILDTAHLLNIPCLNIHTPLDALGRKVMADTIINECRNLKDPNVNDVVSSLMTIPEFRNATTSIKVRLGKPDNLAGKIVVSHGAGTNGGYEIAKTYFQHGVNTLIYIHISWTDLEKLRSDAMGNLIITGHIASDSIGINPLIEELEKNGLSVTRLGIVPP